MTASCYNELMGIGSYSGNYSGMSRELWYPLMDNAANTTVVDQSGRGRDGTAAANTSGKTTTGPNSWLTAALSFNNSSDGISTPFSSALNDFTVLGRYYALATSGESDRIVDKSYDTGFWVGRNLSSSTQFGGGILQGDPPFGVYSATSNNAWHSLAMSRASTSQVVYADGSSAASQTCSGSATNAYPLYIGRSFWGSSKDYWYGNLSEVALFSRALSSGEVSDWHNGPEPVNSYAPSLSGTQTEGQTLTCSSGTWGLASPFSSGSNGTITYSYQWTRSNDGSGSGEANISGATSSTYILQAADVGKYIRCFVRASNDGGYDVAADTASGFTGAIAGAGGGANRLLNLRRRAAAA